MRSATRRRLLGIADALATLDVASALAELAAAARHARPVIDNSVAFRYPRGRHPVVEAALAGGPRQSLRPQRLRSVARRGVGRLWLVTGPNMAGKSTFLRQNALIAILAQMGAFVPADAAHIGIVDRLFSRVGAADDLARGRSTFMVEMVETAAILNQATAKSLVILDEIGRGTATFDGLAIAWATVEHLHEKNKSRALFATHYHEMTALAERLSSLACVTMRVSEWNDTIVFLHEVAPGAADRSYGIHVAKLAGLARRRGQSRRRRAARAGGRPRGPQAARPHRRSAALRRDCAAKAGEIERIRRSATRHRARHADAERGAGADLQAQSHQAIVSTTGPRRVATSVCSYCTVAWPPSAKSVQSSSPSIARCEPVDRNGSMVKTSPS